MKLSGLNHLRAALETKNLLKLDVPQDSQKHKYILWYIESQFKIFTSAIKSIKRMEKEILKDEKDAFNYIENVFKKIASSNNQCYFWDSLITMQY